MTHLVDTSEAQIVEKRDEKKYRNQGGRSVRDQHQR